MNKPTRYYSSKQENFIAKLFEGRTTGNSGAGLFNKGDVIVKDASLLIECKTLTKEKDSISVKKEWLDKNKIEARQMRLSNTTVCFNFGPDNDNYFIIDEKLMRYLIEKLREDEN